MVAQRASAAATCLLAVAALAALSGALACKLHVSDNPAEQPTDHYIAVMQQQREDMLAGFARRAAADGGGRQVHAPDIAAGARRLLAPVKSRRHSSRTPTRSPEGKRAANWFRSWQAAQAAARPSKRPTKRRTSRIHRATRKPTHKPTRKPARKPTKAPTAAPSAATVVQTTPALALPPGVPELRQRQCGYAADEEIEAAATAELAPRVAFLTSDAAPRGIVYNINTYFHIVSSDGTTGALPDSMLVNQIKVLNDAYDEAGFQFTLSGITRHTNASWYPLNIFAPAKTDMQAATRQGGAADLNIWVAQLNNGGIIGVSSNPWGGGVGYIPYDGVTIDSGTLPGSWYGGYNVGMNAVHETGHWLGLSHPFLGGCSETNDGVTDTAEQSAANYNCYPKGSVLPNSCPSRPANQPKLDPVNNYMGYTYDACMWEFTTLQQARMAAAWQAYRLSSAGPAKPLEQSTPGLKPARRPTKKRPTKRRPTKKRPTKKRPTKRRPTKKRPTKKRPTRKGL